MSDLEKQEQNLVEWLADMKEEEAFDLAKKMLLEEGADPLRVLELCRNAMDIVGKRFEQGEYFLPELVLAGEMLENIGAIAKPLIKQKPGEEPKKLAKVLIGTVHGDLHDIGKNIVTFMLDINGFEVKDIGVDVPVDTFLEEINTFCPDIVGLSGFLTLAFDSMKETIEAPCATIPAPTPSAPMRSTRSRSVRTGWGWRHERAGPDPRSQGRL